MDFVIGEAKIRAQNMTKLFRILHLIQAHTQFIDSAIAGEQMSTAIIDLAALRVDHAEFP
jgi:hypothetical protein